MEILFARYTHKHLTAAEHIAIEDENKALRVNGYLIGNLSAKGLAWS